MNFLGEGGGLCALPSERSFEMLQSTNDVFPTAMQLVTVFLIDGVIREVAIIVKSFSRKRRAFDHVLKSGPTHLMDAVPIRVGRNSLLILLR